MKYVPYASTKSFCNFPHYLSEDIPLKTHLIYLSVIAFFANYHNNVLPQCVKKKIAKERSIKLHLPKFTIIKSTISIPNSIFLIPEQRYLFAVFRTFYLIFKINKQIKYYRMHLLKVPVISLTSYLKKYLIKRLLKRFSIVPLETNLLYIALIAFFAKCPTTILLQCVK